MTELPEVVESEKQTEKPSDDSPSPEISSSDPSGIQENAVKNDVTLFVRPLAVILPEKKAPDPTMEPCRLDLDLLINQYNLKSDEIPFLMGEKIPSSNSDESYGSYNSPGISKFTTDESPSLDMISSQQGETCDTKESGNPVLDEKIMQSWLADGSDDSAGSIQKNDMEQLLDLDEEESDMEEFKEIIQHATENAKGNEHQNLDLLTGDDETGNEDSNARPIPPIPSTPVRETSEDDVLKKTEQLSKDTIENCGKKYMEHLITLVNERVASSNENIPTKPNEFVLEDESEAQIDNYERNEEGSVASDSTEDENEYDAEVNCLKLQCERHKHKIGEWGLRKRNVADKLISDSNVTGISDVDKIFARCSRKPRSSIGFNDNKEDDGGSQLKKEADDHDSHDDLDDAEANVNGSQFKSILKTEKSAADSEDKEKPEHLSDDKSLSQKHGEENCQEVEMKSMSKARKRVTFADETDMKRDILGMEPMAAKHDLECCEIQETHPDLTTALRFMTEAYPNRDDEDILSDTLSMPTEVFRPSRSRRESPTAAEIYEELKIIQGEESTEQQISRTHSSSPRKSPQRALVQEEAVKEEIRPANRPNNKFVKLCKSFKRKIGKIL